MKERLSVVLSAGVFIGSFGLLNMLAELVGLPTWIDFGELQDVTFGAARVIPPDKRSTLG